METHSLRNKPAKNEDGEKGGFNWWPLIALSIYLVFMLYLATQTKKANREWIEKSANQINDLRNDVQRVREDWDEYAKDRIKNVPSRARRNTQRVDSPSDGTVVKGEDSSEVS